MTWLKEKFRSPEIAIFGIITAVVAVAALSETARAAGIGLFRQVADSYLIMFIDTMSMGFVCF